jgi:hypothetical protein
MLHNRRCYQGLTRINVKPSQSMPTSASMDYLIAGCGYLICCTCLLIAAGTVPVAQCSTGVLTSRVPSMYGVRRTDSSWCMCIVFCMLLRQLRFVDWYLVIVHSVLCCALSMQWHSAAGWLYRIVILHIIIYDCSTVCCAVILSLCCDCQPGCNGFSFVIALCCFSNVMSAMPAGDRARGWCWIRIGCRPGRQFCCYLDWVVIVRGHSIPAAGLLHSGLVADGQQVMYVTG